MDYCELFLLRSLKTRKSSESSIGTDIEKAQTFSLQSLHSESEDHSSSTDEIQESKYHRWATSIRGLETRGIGPVPIAERHKDGDNGSASLSMALLWFSMTLATNDIIVGSIGTLVLELSFRDAALCAVFGNLLGAVAVGYISVWGPRSGNRTLV